MKRIHLVLIFCIACAHAQTIKRETDREHDGLVGPVKRLFEVWSPLSGSNYPAGSLCRDLTKVYEEGGRLLQQSFYPGPCGSDELREDYTYAADGSRTTKSQEFRGKDSPPPPPPMAAPPGYKEEPGEARMVFKYSSAGKLVEAAAVKPSGKVMYKTTYSYDEQGRIVEVTGYDRDGQVTVRRVYSYSSDSRVPSTFTYYGGDGKVYEKTAYSDYEFNSVGDWVKRKETREQTFNRKSISIISREIEYYSIKR